MRRRVEATPKQQLAELRRAYEHYAALANRLRGAADSAVDADLQRALARNASRIAEAYKKSITKSCLQMERMAAAEVTTLPVVRTVAGLVIIILITAAGAIALAHRSQLVQLALSFTSNPSMIGSDAVATREIKSFTPSATKPTVPNPVRKQMRNVSQPVQVSGEERPLAGPTPEISSKTIVISPQKKGDSGSHSKLGEPTLSAAMVPPMAAESVNRPTESKEAAGEATRASAQITSTDAKLPPTHSRDDIRPAEPGVSQVEIAISDAGLITDCHVVKSSGTARLDDTACAIVEGNWQPTAAIPDKKPRSGAIEVSVIWNFRPEK